MNKPSLLLTIMALLGALPAVADPLSGMDGSWTGTGWAKERPDDPRERVRCRLKNNYKESGDKIVVVGLCAAPGRRVQVEGSMRRSTHGAIDGFWYNPDGVGRSRIEGNINGMTVTFKVDRKDIKRIVSWQLKGSQLHLKTLDGEDQSKVLADIVFKR